MISHGSLKEMFNAGLEQVGANMKESDISQLAL